MNWSREEFLSQMMNLRHSYHLEHPFQVKMNAGELNRVQMQGWVINRYYYQHCIPMKDAAILSNCPDRSVRRIWMKRIIDQDGTTGNEGGQEAWLALGHAVGLRRADIESLKFVLPGVRFAVDSYLNFARTAPWQEAVCSSLTELFARDAHQKRLDCFPIHYPWIEETGLKYFNQRLTEAKRDVDHGLQITLDYFQSQDQQQTALDIIRYKMKILWSMLDAIQLAYVTNGVTNHDDAIKF